MDCECGDKMSLVEMPTEILCFRIPFTRCEIRLWHYKEEYQCHWCNVAEHHDERELEIAGAYDSGYEKGWTEREARE